MIHFFTYPTRAMKQQQMTAAKYKLGETVELFTIYIRHFNLSMMASSWRRWPRTPCSGGSWWRRGGWWRRTRGPCWNWESPRLAGVLNSFVIPNQSDISSTAIFAREFSFRGLKYLIRNRSTFLQFRNLNYIFGTSKGSRINQLGLKTSNYMNLNQLIE